MFFTYLTKLSISINDYLHNIFIYNIDINKSFPYISYKNTLMNDFQYTSCVPANHKINKIHFFIKIDFNKLYIYF